MRARMQVMGVSNDHEGCLRYLRIYYLALGAMFQGVGLLQVRSLVLSYLACGELVPGIV